MTIIARLRTPTAILAVLCSALLAQLPHAADVFRLVVMGDGVWATLHSYTYAVALELAVLLFVVQHRNVESYLFAAVSILVNLSYYHLHGVALWTWEAAPAWLISIALPAAIAQYSHLIAAATEAPTAAPVTRPARRWRWWQASDADLLPDTFQSDTELTPTPVASDNDVTAQPAAPDNSLPVDVAQLVSLSNSEIARRCEVSRQTVAKWREAGVLTVKLADKLPQQATAHTNGRGHTYAE